MNTPDSFKNQYFAYRTDYLKDSTIENYRAGIKFKVHKPLEFDQAAANLIVTERFTFQSFGSCIQQKQLGVGIG